MRDATGAVQSVLVLGGAADLARAVVAELASQRLERVVLAVRDPEAAEDQAEQLRADGLTVELLRYDATDPAAHGRVLDEASATGDLDVVLVAFGLLGEPFQLDQSADALATLAETNFTGGIGAATAAARTLEAQGHGSLVIFSSVAGERVRPDNAVYGASKAGLDQFARALADSLHDTAVHVMVVRPGFVRTKMTAGMDDAPFATTPERVAADVVDGLRRNRTVVWSPPILRWVFAGLRVLPGPLWRRVSSQ